VSLAFCLVSSSGSITGSLVSANAFALIIRLLYLIGSFLVNYGLIPPNALLVPEGVKPPKTLDLAPKEEELATIFLELIASKFKLLPSLL